jgi:amino acid transporter
MLAT